MNNANALRRFGDHHAHNSHSGTPAAMPPVAALPKNSEGVMNVETRISKVRSMIMATIAAACVIVAVACGSSPTSSTTVSSIAVTGSAPAIGATSQFTAMATLSSGTTQDVTSSATWTTSDSSLATVSSSGLVTGVASGAVTLQATYSGVTGTESLTIP